jgi:hypothetical protein
MIAKYLEKLYLNMKFKISWWPIMIEMFFFVTIPDILKKHESKFIRLFLILFILYALLIIHNFMLYNGYFTIVYFGDVPPNNPFKEKTLQLPDYEQRFGNVGYNKDAYLRIWGQPDSTPYNKEQHEEMRRELARLYEALDKDDKNSAYVQKSQMDQATMKREIDELERYKILRRDITTQLQKGRDLGHITPEMRYRLRGLLYRYDYAPQIQNERQYIEAVVRLHNKTCHPGNRL